MGKVKEFLSGIRTWNLWNSKPPVSIVDALGGITLTILSVFSIFGWEKQVTACYSVCPSSLKLTHLPQYGFSIGGELKIELFLFFILIDTAIPVTGNHYLGKLLWITHFL